MEKIKQILKKKKIGEVSAYYSQNSKKRLPEKLSSRA